MPGALFHFGATVMCPHGGQVTVATSNTRVFVSAQPVATAADVLLVAGCAFNVASKPQPCVTVKSLTPATRVFVNGQPALLQTTADLTQSAEQIPQGSSIKAATQPRVTGL